MGSSAARGSVVVVPFAAPSSPAVAYTGVTGEVVAEAPGLGALPSMAGVNVTAYSEACSGPIPSPSDCPRVASTLTNATGFFGLNLSAGNYYLAALPDPDLATTSLPYGFGGASQVISASANTTAALRVYPLVPYGNATLVLPDWNCLSGYLYQFAKGNASNCQNPVLAWTQDGAFYVNATDELVFYSFPNATVVPLHPWVPLWQTFPNYGMVPNEAFITQDGSYIYGWGTLSRSGENLTFEAINLTTRQFFEHNFTGVTTANVSANGQVEMTGWDGNDSLVTLVLSTGQVVDYNIWNQTQWTGPRFDFFEANNVYWEPYLNGYVDVRAGGSALDEVEEWQLTGPSGDLVRTFLGQWSTAGLLINGVNGLAFNLSSRVLSFEGGSYAGWVSAEMSVDGSGTITGFPSVVLGRAGTPALGPAAASDRSTLLTGGPFLQGDYEGFSNDSFLGEAGPGSVELFSTNVSPYIVAGVGPVHSWQQWQQEGQFFNTSYLISPDAYTCAHTSAYEGSCAINGSRYAEGTIWWYWKLGLPEFPFSIPGPLAQTSGPGLTDVVGAATTASSIVLSWVPPTAPGAPILNYSVAWGPIHGAWTGRASVGGASRSYLITGLAPGANYSFSVEAWNLHYHGLSAGLGSAVTVAGAGDLAVSSRGNTSIGLTWVDPSRGEFTNISLAYGTSAGTLPQTLSLGPVASYVVTGLGTDTPYYFEVTAWNGTTESTPSNQVSATTLVPNPTGLSATGVTTTEVSLAWVVPPAGEFTNLTVEYGTGPGALSSRSSVGKVAQYTVGGLGPGATYYFALVAWNGSDASPPTREVRALTFALPPSRLEVTNVTLHEVWLAWTPPPSGEFTNLTVEYGTSPTALPTQLSVGMVSNATVPDLAPGTRYYFTVVAWNGSSFSLPSNEVSAETTPAAPTGLEEALAATPWIVVPLMGGLLGYSLYVRRRRPSP